MASSQACLLLLLCVCAAVVPSWARVATTAPPRLPQASADGLQQLRHGVVTHSGTGPAFPPRTSGYFTTFTNRCVVGDPSTSTFALAHFKNGRAPDNQRHMAVLSNAGDNSTQYNLLVFSDVAGSHGWIWEYYAPASCHFIHNSAHGQKRPGLIKNATYLGRTVLNNGISNEEVDVWNATTPIAGAVQAIRWSQTVARGWPVNLHFYDYPNDDTWFQSFVADTSAYPPLTMFSDAIVPSFCPNTTTTALPAATEAAPATVAGLPWTVRDLIAAGLL